MPEAGPAPVAPGGRAADEGVARSAGRVSLATLVSRVTGLLRETVSAALFGLGPLSDALVFAFRIPNLLREFFAEGALSSAFVPVLAKARADDGEARAQQVARRVFGTLALVTGLVTLLGIVFAPAVVDLIAADAPEEQRPLTVTLTRIMFPFLVLAALAAVAMGVLNTYRRYVVPALASAAFNVVAVLGGAVLMLLGWPAERALLAWAVLVVLGGLAQLLVQAPLVRRVGVHGRPEVDLRLRDPALRAIAGRMGPVVLALAGTNVMLFLTTAIASRGEGWATGLAYAFRLVHLPIGLVGVSIGTVVLAAGARSHAAGEAGGLDDLVRRGLRLSWYLAVPAAVGLFVLAEPLVRMVYDHGRFRDGDGVAITAEALRWYAAAVVGYAGIKAGAPLFLARGDTRTPMLCSLAGIAANLAVAFGGVGALGFRALALAVAVGTGLNFVLLRVFAWRRFGRASAPGTSFVARVLLAGLGMGLAGWGLLALIPAPGMALTLGLCAVLAALYFTLTATLGLSEGRAVLARLRRRPAAPRPP